MEAEVPALIAPALLTSSRPTPPPASAATCPALPSTSLALTASECNRTSLLRIPGQVCFAGTPVALPYAFLPAPLSAGASVGEVAPSISCCERVVPPTKPLELLSLHSSRASPLAALACQQPVYLLPSAFAQPSSAPHPRPDTASRPAAAAAAAAAAGSRRGRTATPRRAALCSSRHRPSS